jgi:hypothetical protein
VSEACWYSCHCQLEVTHSTANCIWEYTTVTGPPRAILGTVTKFSSGNLCHHNDSYVCCTVVQLCPTPTCSDSSPRHGAHSSPDGWCYKEWEEGAAIHHSCNDVSRVHFKTPHNLRDNERFRRHSPCQLLISFRPSSTLIFSMRQFGTVIRTLSISPLSFDKVTRRSNNIFSYHR